MRNERAVTRWTPGIVLLFAALLAAILLAATPAAGRGWLAMLVLLDLRGNDSSLLQDLRPEPLRSNAEIPGPDRPIQADHYLPADRPARATLVLLHGFAPQGRREPRLMALATTLARAGVAVLVPELDGMRSLGVGTEDVSDIAATLRHALAGEEDRTGKQLAHCRPVGLMAFSFAVGPALLAALTPEVRERLDFVVAVGGYYDLEAAITYATTGYDPLSGRRGAPPAPEGRWWLLQSQADRLATPTDRAAMAEIARRRLADPDAAVDDLLPQLGPGGRVLYGLTANTDPARVPALLAALPDDARRPLESLDLKTRNPQDLAAPLVLIHGIHDRMIPISHSRALLAHLGAERARLFEVPGLQHVDIGSSPATAWQLWRAVVHLLTLTGAERPSC